MWIRRAILTDLIARATRAAALDAIIAEKERREADRTAELREARAEIKRLTNVIIQLKERGYALRPEDTDERWGSYSMDEVEAEMVEQPRQVSRAPTPAESDVLDIEREIRAALEADEG